MELKEKRFIIDEFSDAIRYYKLLIKTQSLLYKTLEDKTAALVAGGEAGDEVKRSDIVEIDFCNKKNGVIMNEFMKVTSILHLLYREIIFLGIEKEIDGEIIEFVKNAISIPGVEYILAEKNGIAEFKDNEIRNHLFDISDRSILKEDIPSIFESIKEQYLDFKAKMDEQKNKEAEAKRD